MVYLYQMFVVLFIKRCKILWFTMSAGSKLLILFLEKKTKKKKTLDSKAAVAIRPRPL